MSAADSTMPVEWREVPGYPGYRASFLGDIQTQWVRGKLGGSGGGQKPSTRQSIWFPAKTANNRGRRALHIPALASPTGKRRYIEVHTLVCLAFHGLPKPRQEVRHFPDPNPANNRADNLSWGSRLENQADRVVQGADQRGEKHVIAKLTETGVREIFKLHKLGWKNTELAAKFGVSSGNISNILCGRAWSWLTVPLLSSLEE